MTTTDTRPASRELDAAVARAIFGWRWWRWQPYTYHADGDGITSKTTGPPYRFLGPPDADERGYDISGREARPWDGVEELAVQASAWLVPNYSTDIAAAWLVVEAMLAGDGYRSAVFFDALESRRVGHPRLIGWWYQDRSDVALCICRAALLAVAGPRTTPQA